MRISFYLLCILLFGTAFSSVAKSSSEPEPDSSVTIVEYFDYQCPACKVYNSFLNRLKEDLGEQLIIEYRHFPLRMHPYANLAARAAYAARQQDKFKTMHQRLFENQRSWSRSSARTLIKGYARDIGLDMEQFEEDWNSEEAFTTVQEQKQSGLDRGVRGTPTMFIDGEEIPLPMSYDELKAYVKRKMN